MTVLSWKKFKSDEGLKEHPVGSNCTSPELMNFGTKISWGKNGNRHPTVSVASTHTDNVIDIDACPQRRMVEEKRHFSALLDSILFFSWVLLESW